MAKLFENLQYSIATLTLSQAELRPGWSATLADIINKIKIYKSAALSWEEEWASVAPIPGVSYIFHKYFLHNQFPSSSLSFTKQINEH